MIENNEFYDNMPLEGQVRILADYLMQNHGERIGEIGSEGAIECALRLLKENDDSNMGEDHEG